MDDESARKPQAATVIEKVIVHTSHGPHEIAAEKIPPDGLTLMGPRGEPGTVAEWTEAGERLRVWFGFPMEIHHRVTRIARTS